MHPLEYFPNPCIPESLSWAPTGHSPNGFLVPWTGAPATTTQGQKAFISGCTKRGRGRAWWRGPQESPVFILGQPHGGLLDRTGPLPGAAPASCPRAPTDCWSGGARSQKEGGQLPVTTLANCQERPESHSGNSGLNLGLPVKAWPAVTLKGSGASQKSTDGHSGDN